MNFIIKALLLFVILQYSILAENATLSGFVNDSSNGETLIGATVFIKEAKLGAYTNKNGYYNIKNIPSGKYTLVVSSVGYKKKELSLNIKESESRRLDIKLGSGEYTTADIIVEANRDMEKKQITISKVNVPIQQIKEIRIGGESDIFRSLQLLPGILTSSQISSGLFIRGGSPDQNLVLLDGSAVYNPTHLFGFISTFNTEAIKDVELIKGGFPAEYGGRMSAVLNITQKDGDKENFGGVASVGVISSKLGLEGPIGNGSWFIGGRRTYFELIKSFIEEDPTSPLPNFNFYDVNGKITQDFGENDKFSISGFKSEDDLDFSAFGVALGLTVGNELLSSRWFHIFNDELFLTTNVSSSRYFNSLNGNNSGYRTAISNSISDITAKSNVEWFATPELTMKFGGELTWLSFDYLQNFTGDTDSTADGFNAGSAKLSLDDRNFATFGQLNYLIDDLVSLQAGVRASYWEQAQKTTIDPRMAIRWQVQDNFAIKASWGIFHQNLKLATQPDFSFFDTWLSTDTSLNISRSDHYIISFETQPVDGYDLNFDVYYKKYYDINELNRLALTGSQVADFFYEGEGHSYGFEIFLQKKVGQFTGWAGYALGFVQAQFDSINFGVPFRPKFDRRHDLKLVGQYRYDESWEFGAQFTYQTGQSFTGATSRFQSRLPGDSDGRGKIYNSQRWGLRLPPSHQLNVNVSHNFTIFGLKSRATLDIYNLYSRRDIWFRFYDTSEEETTPTDVRLLPILPTLSFEIKF